METLNYYQTLEIVENFMIKSGIRGFCTDICRGKCCISCYGSPQACHKNEGRRLACSVFICCIPNAKMNFLSHKTRFAVHSVIAEIYEKQRKPRKYSRPVPQERMDIYFTKPHPALFTEFKIDPELIEPFYVKSINKMKKVVNEVLRCRDGVIKACPGKNYLYDLSKFSTYSYTDKGVITHYLQPGHFESRIKTICKIKVQTS